MIRYCTTVPERTYDVDGGAVGCILPWSSGPPRAERVCVAVSRGEATARRPWPGCMYERRSEQAQEKAIFNPLPFRYIILYCTPGAGARPTRAPRGLRSTIDRRDAGRSPHIVSVNPKRALKQKEGKFTHAEE